MRVVRPSASQACKSKRSGLIPTAWIGFDLAVKVNAAVVVVVIAVVVVDLAAVVTVVGVTVIVGVDLVVKVDDSVVDVVATAGSVLVTGSFAPVVSVVAVAVVTTADIVSEVVGGGVRLEYVVLASGHNKYNVGTISYCLLEVCVTWFIT